MDVFNVMNLIMFGCVLGVIMWVFNLAFKVKRMLKKIRNAENLCIVLNSMIDFCSESGKDCMTVGFCFEMETKQYEYENICTFIDDICNQLRDIEREFSSISQMEYYVLCETKYLGKLSKRKDTLVYWIDKITEQLNIQIKK